MTEKMLKFVNIGQKNPTKMDKNERKENFNEIYKEFINEKAKEQSSRCSQCGVPFCQIHCPLSNNIPDWLKLTAEGRLQEAYELIPKLRSEGMTLDKIGNIVGLTRQTVAKILKTPK